MTSIRIPAPLRGLTDGRDEVCVDAESVRGALEALTAAYPDLRPRLLDDDGQLRPFVNVFLGSRDVRTLDGQATPVDETDVLTLLPAVAGGGAP